MLSHPPSCRGCPLDVRGRGYAKADGPENAKILLVGEALGGEEAASGRPFVGPSGKALDRYLKLAGIERGTVLVDNVIRCQPPRNWLVGAPWEVGAISHCSPNLDASLASGPRAVVAVGATATRRLIPDAASARKFKLNDWNGTVSPVDNYSVIPTFHPEFLRQGKQKLVGSVVFALQRAKEVADGRYASEPANLVVDPSVDWFADWVGVYLARLGVDGLPPWLSVDIETAQKIAGADEGELEENADEIIRINFAYHPDEGVTVPFYGAYLPLIRKLLDSEGVKCFWNARFDLGKLRSGQFTVRGKCLDFMWAWHVLQSDLPRGLGFVATFFSRFGPWKHLSSSDPGRYAAIDAIQTQRVAFGIAEALRKAGQWEAFWRHVYLLDTRVLHPAEDIGLLIDKPKLEEFNRVLQAKEAQVISNLQPLVPDSLRPEKVYKRRPKGKLGEALGSHLRECKRRDTTTKCLTCSGVDLTKRHKCRSGEADLVTGEFEVTRWVSPLDFNPSSPKQLLKYILHKGLKPGKAKKTGEDTTDKQTLETLARKDPFFKWVLKHRAIEKVRGTYAEPTLRRIEKTPRIHAQFLHVPSTMRLSCVNPNLTNVVGDKSGVDSDASGFRETVVPGPGCVLVESDYSAIEAVLTGYFCDDPDYIRLAKLGIHDYLTSHVAKEPANVKWSDEQLGGYLKEIKAKYGKRGPDGKTPLREKAKRCIHGGAYGQTPWGMHKFYPEEFPTVKAAEEIQQIYFAVCPKLPVWWSTVRNAAHKEHYLGGGSHPFNYKHWFWNVKIWNWEKGDYDPGPDYNRVVAYLPQSTAFGVLAEATLALTDHDDPNFIGDLYYGETPIRALIHDSILSEVEERHLDRYLERVDAVMTRGVPQLGGLAIGAEHSVGRVSWGEMEKVAWQKRN